jgi:hypothetical protein
MPKFLGMPRDGIIPSYESYWKVSKFGPCVVELNLAIQSDHNSISKILTKKENKK